MRPPVAVAALLLAAATVAACGGDLGPPRPRPAPTPDTVAPLLEGGARSPRLASYAIDARLDASARRIEATETLTWTNSGTSAVDALPFHLYMNAFKNEDSVFMQESHGHHRNVEFTEHWGWIDVTSVKIAGAELHDQVRWPGPDETVMEVPLAAPVGPGESIAVELTFTTQLPEVFARTGYKGAFLMIGQWFPKIGVRTGPPGAERWACAPFHLDSEFFADFGTYDVRLTVPTTHVVAATGVLTDTTDNPDGTRTLTYRAEDVHDFAWMADPYMQVISGQAKVGDHTVEVRVYHRPAQAAFARRHLAAGIGAIETFSRLLIPYPWPIMTVIDPPVGADGAAGMEYPTLVTTAGDSWWARDGIRLPEYVTIHEIGHNWFQGMLASNEVDEAWLDEGVNDWADGEVIAELYGDRGGLVDWLGIQVELHRAMRAAAAPLASVPSPIATASWAFVDADAYGDATYRKTELALKTLENLVGRDTFLAAMKGYATTWAFRHPTGRDFFAAVEQGVGRDLAWFWGPVFYGTGSVD
ncbi:MAG: M1 family metallopeptidase, partial [Kofleriaceae bacterium]|nr:M1 family metallopeptidase [Kofleriaceae bacterium]